MMGVGQLNERDPSTSPSNRFWLRASVLDLNSVQSSPPLMPLLFVCVLPTTTTRQLWVLAMCPHSNRVGTKPLTRTSTHSTREQGDALFVCELYFVLDGWPYNDDDDSVWVQTTTTLNRFAPTWISCGCVCGSKSGQSSKMGLSLFVPQQPSMTIIMIKLFLDLVNKTKAPRPRSVGGCVCSLFSALSTPA